MRRLVLWMAVMAVMTLPAALAAQVGEALLGRAYDAASDAAVQNAIVTLEGFGSTLTGPDGAFRFRGVSAGTYTLRVEAFSYATRTLEVTLPDETRIDVALESSPLALDSIVVEAGTVDYHGRVRDPDRDFLLVDAEVLVGGREPVWTDAHGRFNVDDLAEGVPVNLSVRAFGYLPVDTTLVPDDEERYDFDLERDTFAEAMMAIQVRRLEERAGGRLSTGWLGAMDRERIVRYTGSHTAGTMLGFEYPARIVQRIACAFIDERPIDGIAGLREDYLTHTLPEEIERVELLQWDSYLGRPLMLQIYTRSFIAAMAASDGSLRTPTMIQTRPGEYRCR